MNVQMHTIWILRPVANLLLLLKIWFLDVHNHCTGSSSKRAKPNVNDISTIIEEHESDDSDYVDSADVHLPCRYVYLCKQNQLPLIIVTNAITGTHTHKQY